jgi:hypothetical protein
LVQLKKVENLMQNLTVILSDKLQECWLCRHTFMASSPLGDRVAHPGSTAIKYFENVTCNFISIELFRLF